MNNRHRNRNVIQILQSRCTNGKKLHRQVLKSLLRSPLREFKLSWTSTVNNGVSYDGNLYVHKYSSYFQGCYSKGKPHFLRTNHLKTLPEKCNHAVGERFIKDTLIYESPVTKLNDAKGLYRGDYSNCLFVLTCNSYVIQYFMGSDGWVSNKCVYLGSCRFSHLNYDNQMDNFIAKSIRQNTSNCDADLCYYFACFKSAPFEFIAAFEITKSIFGTVKDAFVINGVIVILSSTSYSFYSLNYVVENFLVGSFHFGGEIDSSLGMTILGNSDMMTANQSSPRVGDHGYGLPLNLKITSKPPCLFSVPSKEVSGLSFGGFPWYCLGSSHEYSKLYQVHSGNVVATLDHGKYAYSFNLDDEKKAYFHPDRSGRLLCVEYDSIKCLRIRNDQSNERDEKENIEIVPCYTISYGQQLKVKPIQRRSRSGRMYKPTQPSKSTSLPSEIVHSLDYDDDLNILAVLYTHATAVTSQANKYMIGLYDNESGAEIRRKELDTTVSDKDEHEWNLFFDGFLMVCTLKLIGSRGKTIVFMYQMFERTNLQLESLES